MATLLPAIVQLAISTDKPYCVKDNLLHKLNCVNLGKLISLNPDLLGFVLHYFDLNPAPFESVNQLSKQAKRYKTELSSVSIVSDYDIVVACYNILQVATEHFKHHWNWSKFYHYLLHKESNVRWVALKCVAIILEISEDLQLSSAKLLIKDFDNNYNFKIFFESYVDTKNVTTSDFNNIQSIDNLSIDISSVTNVGGILLPAFKKKCYTEDFDLVPVPSTQENLCRLSIAIASRKCICLQGAVGCGKTSLVEYLAKTTGHDSDNFIKVQLGDQTDSKMLLGMYRCTDIPGEFTWQPGILTHAVTTGKWLLLEDIDSAALDVASVLSNLMETGTLSVPGYRDVVYAKSGFQMFVTQRLITSATGLHRQTSAASNLLQKHWLCVNVEPLSKDELITIVQVLFPTLKTIAIRIVDVFLLFSMGNHEVSNSSNGAVSFKTVRQTSTRDLIKWCSRAVIDFDVSSPDSALKLFQDALDVFCCSVPDREQQLLLAVAVANKLGIIKTKAEYFCNVHKPGVMLTPELFLAGRAKLSRKTVHIATIKQAKINFSFTRPSACLLERIASCVIQKEPVLLVGETGTGKTSSVQYLARSMGYKLVVINMNQQSESADLLGGYKPVDIKFLISPIREDFEILFRSYFAVEPNKKFLEHVALCYKESKWKTLVSLMNHSTIAAIKRLNSSIKKQEVSTVKINESGRRKRKNENSIEQTDRDDKKMLEKWEKLATSLNKLMLQVKTLYSIAFSFVEGSLIKALKEGYWVLLDEINLANAETLECLSGLLERSSGSLSLLERGDRESIKRHKDFTLFACMNPATDIGKKDLPVGLRNRFTEFYVDELTERSDLLLLVTSYLKELNLPPAKLEAIVKFYLKVRKEAANTLYDGTAHKPHYSLRTLCRALSISANNPCGNVLRSLYEAFSVSFLTQLDNNSYPIVQKMIATSILDNKTMKAILGTPIPKPNCTADTDYVSFEGYWVKKGSLETNIPKNYILTPSVRRNLKDLVRVVSIGKIPVLLQGDTSVGKTSLITYLAKASGHVCVRINNHEHTDLQEYVGSYVSNESGKLIFKEGVLVEAMRKGHWIILDELNLAPSDVLEALNRVLDDNRELFIPETQKLVKAHDNFMLFATQNPPGLYGGRKTLSRAFRNRFVELHFDEIPSIELQTILHERCSMPESYCKQIIGVMTDLQLRRKNTAAFAGKKGFITLRDLFRWGERYRLANDVGSGLYDWSQHLADEGYLVLSAKVRKLEEADEIRLVIKKHLKRDVNPTTLFTLNDNTSSVTKSILQKILNNSSDSFKHIVCTYNMRRMAVLVEKSCQFKEPVLLVGETGGGKTTVCQLIASINKQNIYSVNCHMHSESSDFLGNLRPVRERSESDNQRLFEWVDGPLINAMRNGALFLADEISLADDSVLERLNSLLEPERSLLLAEKENSTIVANEKFVFVGTMNPGGDYGKKELSPALRNRFTEIWCESHMDNHDMSKIIQHNLHEKLQSEKESIALAILNFIDWLPLSEIGKKLALSIRDVLTWVKFINFCVCDASVKQLSIGEAYYHGACLTYIDGLGAGLTGSENLKKLNDFRDAAFKQIKFQIKDTLKSGITTSTAKTSVCLLDDAFGISPFYIKRGGEGSNINETFNFDTPTTKLNTLKLLRAMQLLKPILLEGSPGVGKTSLVSALAKASGHSLLRINLSDQTDISDLFGADLPVEGGKGGEFAWKDGPFLRALRAGHWILLDELNLASQSVLEGLNACFDHRGEIYIPELGKTFYVLPGTKLFACQNPLSQGGARRGLPKSFLNRFTQVFVDLLNDDDLCFIVKQLFPQFSSELAESIIRFNAKLASEAGVLWGHLGSPWEMNLRDIVRWCEAIVNLTPLETNNYNPGKAMEVIYNDRMRTQEDRKKVLQLYEEMFPIEKYPLPPNEPLIYITTDKLYVGDVALSRTNRFIYTDQNLLLLRDQMPVLRSLVQCINMNWMSILVGGSGSGKSSVVHLLATLAGQKLKSITVNSAMDTTEILGGFEQTDYNRHLEELLGRAENVLVDALKMNINPDNIKLLEKYHGLLENIRRLSDEESDVARTMSAETDLFLRRVKESLRLVSEMNVFDSSCSMELQEIYEKLKQLSKLVQEDDCLNAGGKFEWVDSVLVKCLQEGSWLLIDQVNMCSPAVLDRLNGLLEPNGILSIGERGVDEEGNIVTVKPHKNFRLFLTMNPRYGEISRAMRNRGVEIYMLGPKENKEYNITDLRSLLFNNGVTSLNQQDMLLDIHRKLSEELPLAEKWSIVELLHSAFLIKRYLLRDFPIQTAIKNACVDVYVKTSFVRLEVKQKLISIIDDVIQQYSSIESHCSVDFDAATWSVKNLRNNSRLTVIRQQGLVLQTAVEVDKTFLSNEAERTVNKLNKLFDYISQDNILNDNISDVILYLLLNFYEKSSVNDHIFRRQWVDKIFGENNVPQMFLDTNNKMCQAITSFKFGHLNEAFPWDLAQLPGIDISDKEACKLDANKLAFNLYLIIMPDWIELPKSISVDKDQQILSILQYSDAVNNGNLPELLKDQPLITNFSVIVKKLQSFVNLYFNDNSVVIDADDYVELRKQIKWCSRFQKLGQTDLLDRTKKSMDMFLNLDEVSLLLRIHYKWLIKFLQNLVYKNNSSKKLNTETENTIQSLINAITWINNRLTSIHDPFRKICKKVKKYLNHPLPHSSETSMLLHSDLSQITKTLSPYSCDNMNIIKKQELKIFGIQMEECLKQRYVIMSLWNDLYLNRLDDSEKTKSITLVKDFLDDSYVGLRSTVELGKFEEKMSTFNEKLMTEASLKAQLWPFYEYLFLLYSFAVQRKICDEVQTNCNETIPFITNFVNVPSIPANLVSLLNTLLNNIGTEQKLYLLPELFIRILQYSRNSYAIQNSEILSQWGKITDNDTVKIYTESSIKSSIGEPILLNLVLRLILNENKNNKETNLATAKLGEYKFRTNQLKTLCDTLWRNSAILTSNKYSISVNDNVTLKSYLGIYISAIEKGKLEYNIDELIQNAIKRQEKYSEKDYKIKYESDYLQPVECLRSISKELNQDGSNKINEKQEALKRGKAWMLLGYIQIFLFGNLDYIDPVHKVQLQLEYVEEDIDDWRKTIYTTKIQSHVMGKLQHPRQVAIEKDFNNLLEEKKNLQRLKAFRPQLSRYAALGRDIANFKETVVCYQIISKHIDNLINVAERLQNSHTSANLKGAEDALKEAEMWQTSIERFSEQIENSFLSGYPDIVLPLLLAMSQLRYGISILIYETKRLTSLTRLGFSENEINSLVHNLIRYPTVGTEQESLLDLVDLCVSRNTKELINKQFNVENVFLSLQEQFRLTKCGLYELYNHIIVNRGLTTSLWKKLNLLLQQIVLMWKKQQKEIEKRKAESENLYKNKADVQGNVMSEEEEISMELKKLFPTSRNEDFCDIEDLGNVSLEQRPDYVETTNGETFTGLITDSDMDEIQQIHSNIVVSFITSKWLKNGDSSVSPDYVKPLIQRYNIIDLLSSDLKSSLSENIMTKLYSSINFMSAITLQASQGKLNSNLSKNSPYDFYRDCNIEEVKQCVLLLDIIYERVNQLLNEWPEHPSLKSIKLIISRLYSFPITSSVSRFLTGLEILLVKMHEWEENAHSGVSLSEYTLNLTQQIISWRRLELACWKDCLKVAFNRLSSQTSKWWFHLYALVESFLLKSTSNTEESTIINNETNVQPTENITKAKLIETLEIFMNQSPLVEFQSRLNLIMSFHCHVYYFDPSSERDELLSILWNIYHYYKQFTTDVESRIKVIRGPIEKKLKEFVKIARWNDINYWSVKETVAKTHRTLHKLIKEFETALKQSVASCLIIKYEAVNPEKSKGMWDDCNSRDYVIDYEDYLVCSPKSIESSNKLPIKSKLISRSKALLSKTKYLCKDIILMSSYPCLRMEIENFVQDTVSHSLHLKEMELDRSLPKGKQKSQAKSILQQKKMALSNYFKVLSNIGISYRTGLLKWKNNNDEIIDFTVPPLDLSVVMRYVKNSRVYEQMLIQWTGCEKYYYKSISKLNALNAMLLSTKTDLGLQNMERCKGFSVHLMLLAHQQKKLITEVFNDFICLRLKINNLARLESNDTHTPKQSDLKASVEVFKNLLTYLEIGFEQLELYLQSASEDNESEADEEIIMLDAKDSSIFSSNKNSAIWNTANIITTDSIVSIKSMMKSFENVFVTLTMPAKESKLSDPTVLLTSKHFEYLKQNYVEIKNIKSKMKNLLPIFCTTDGVHPIEESLKFLESKVNDALKNFEDLRITVSSENQQQVSETNDEIDVFEKNLEQLLNIVLLALQKKYKDNASTDNDLPNEPEADDKEDDEEYDRNKFKEKLIESLEKDIQSLTLKQVYQQLNNVLIIMNRLDVKSLNHCNWILQKCYPLLDQYVTLIQFFFNEQIASFRVTCKLLYLQLNVFLDLATNGFCVPKDLDIDEEEGEEAQDNTGKGGMGLGEGEGQKDVSDRIESEDQLEDARPAGQEEDRPEDKDCREEDKGIDMSEDFDSKLQDLEKDDNDGENSESDEDTNDLDKQMGETEEGAEELDKEIWGDDDESENEEEDNEKDDGRGKGEETGENEMSAKDDNRKNNEEDKEDERNNKEREKEQKDINEIQEPETNDDQIDPYHGNHQPQPEPEPLDLPEDLNLDDEDAREDKEGEEDNPFDIDEMKESRPPPEKEEVEEEKEKKENEANSDFSDEEEDEAPNSESTGQTDNDKEAQDSDKDEPETSHAGSKDPESSIPEEEENPAEETAAPSHDNASKEIDANDQSDPRKDGSRDKAVQQTPNQEDGEGEDPAESHEDVSDDKGVGQAQSEKQETGHSNSNMQQSAPLNKQDNFSKPLDKRKNPGKSDENRSLLDEAEPDKKKMKIHSQDERPENTNEEGPSKNEHESAEIVTHVTNSEDFDDHAMDAATENQIKKQTLNMDEEEDKEKEDDNPDVEMHDEEEENLHEKEVPKKSSEKTQDGRTEKPNNDASKNKEDNENGAMETVVDIEGVNVETNRVERGSETTFHTKEIADADLSPNLVQKKRFEIEKMLGQWTQVPSTEEAAQAWNTLSTVTDSAARDLSEKLRLVLEPTQASRLKGDYRTGRRINMRKIIPYIASQFRKDKIWLRRTKPSKRDYQIVLALDDSSSMADNHSKELAFESLSLISKAMTYLEVGQLCVISFGEEVNVLHPLGESFTEQSGSRLIQEMRFDQKKTMIGQLVDFTVDMFDIKKTSVDNAKLLVVLSDGRGIFSEGIDKVNQAVRRARLADIFLVFIIVDNPINKDSILDIRMPVFEQGKLMGIQSYMDHFPFPFYMILRDINMLPGILSDALRQWFEIVGKIDA